MVKLSVVIITFNEEKNIKKCLDSVIDISDDIIIIDSFSNDNTLDICSKYPTVRFIQKEWAGYSKTKNFANKQAQHPYILSLDADEVLSTELKRSIQNIQKLEGVFEFNRLTNYCGSWVKHCGWYPDKKIRIFPKNEVFWEGDYVHETLVVPPHLNVSFLEGDLLHYSYYTLSDHYQQIEKYYTLHAKKMIHDGKSASIYKLLISPTFKFIKTYFLQLGFLDGKAGYQISKISAFAVKLKYQKLRNLES